MPAAPAASAPITILHLAVDYNTPQRPRTTTAIEWMVAALPDYHHVVIAYRRQPRPSAGQESDCGSIPHTLYDFPYFGLPFGVGLHAAMREAARRAIARLEQDGVRPAIVHAHKLTFEGIAGWYVARHFGVPLFVSLRGEVETKVFRRKPRLRPFLRRLCGDAARLYLVSAWFRDEFHRYVPAQADKERLLPNIVRNLAPVITPQPAGDALVSVFNLDTWQRKGVRWLLDGMQRAVTDDPAIRLDIIGGGSDGSRARVSAMIAARGLQDNVRLCGSMANADLLARLGGYRALVLPSLNETFGMVYVEALFAGIPVLFTRGTAIDGYLDGLDVAVTVPARDSAAIAAGITRLWRESDQFRARIAAAAPTLFARFDPGAALDRYRADVSAVTRSA